MNDADVLLIQVIQQARALGIPVSGDIRPQVRINRRAVTRLGCCICDAGAYTIEISARLLTAEERVCRQTLAHEVLHTCPGCRNHGAVWKGYAAAMNRAYGYAISRTADPAALGLAEGKPARYLVVCQSCGREFPRMKKTGVVTHPERYRCRCGGTLARRTAGEGGRM